MMNKRQRKKWLKKNQNPDTSGMATGRTLDYCGLLLDKPRNGMDDAAYRKHLKDAISECSQSTK